MLRTLTSASLTTLGLTLAALAAPEPALPHMPAKTFNITQFGAVGDGKTLNTVALQKTIDTAAAAGGGIVLVPEGRFLTEPFTLGQSNQSATGPGSNYPDQRRP